MNVPRLTRSASRQEAGSARPSELAAVLQSETLPGMEYSEASPKAVSIVLSSVVFALQREVLSRDTWALAMMSAAREARGLGVSEDELSTVMEQLQKTRAARHASNPLSAMF